MKSIHPHCWLRVLTAHRSGRFTASAGMASPLLWMLAALVPSLAIETSQLRMDLTPGPVPTLRSHENDPKNTSRIRERKQDDSQRLEFRDDPDLALVVESVCLLERAFSGRSAGGRQDALRATLASAPHLSERASENTADVLSALNEIMATMPVTRHEFASSNHDVQRAVFGEGPDAVKAVFNAGFREFRHKARLGGEVRLPPFGFVVEGPGLAAFFASCWAGVDYDVPQLFVLRSLDGQPLSISGRVHVFHAFGDGRLNFAGAIRTIEREDIIAPQLTTRAAP